MKSVKVFVQSKEHSQGQGICMSGHCLLTYFSQINTLIHIYVNTNSFSDEYCIYINTKTGDWYHANSTYNTSSAVGGSLRLSFKPETILNDSSIKTKEDVNKYLGELIDAINAL